MTGWPPPSNDRRVNEESFEVLNPATKEILETISIDTRESVFAKMKKVRAAAGDWAKRPVKERCAVIRSVQRVIVDRAEEIANLIHRENGKPVPEAFLHDLVPTLLTMNYFVENAPRVLRDERLRLKTLRHRKSYLSYQPKGVIGVITPWNYPFFMPGSDVCMALLAGNGVLLKPSEVTPLSSVILKECYDAAGFPEELFQVVYGLGATGQALIESQPDHIVFTGSVPTGRRVGVACAEKLISYTLELGGKAPAVVLEDADLDRAAHGILWGGFANAGQICASVERVFALEGIYDELTERVAGLARSLKVGPSPRGAIDLGAITFPRQLEIVKQHVEDAKKKGGRILAGGEPLSETGDFHQPTVIADCTPEMSVMNEEIFGPVIPFMRVENEAQAIKLANTSHLGLGGYVFGKNRARAKRVAEQLEVGSVMINDVVLHAGIPEMPWGGIKQSGLGVVRSERGLQELCNARHINLDRVRPLKRDPYWFPYSEKQPQALKKLLRAVFGPSIGSRILQKILS